MKRRDMLKTAALAIPLTGVGLPDVIQAESDAAPSVGGSWMGTMVETLNGSTMNWQGVWVFASNGIMLLFTNNQTLVGTYAATEGNDFSFQLLKYVFDSSGRLVEAVTTNGTFTLRNGTISGKDTFHDAVNGNTGSDTFTCTRITA